MKILVDADSCPKEVRDLVIRAAERTGISAVFAANRMIPGIEGKPVRMELCPPGEGKADDRIVSLAEPGDLVLTRDIPLAERVVKASVTALDDRGRVFTPENIGQALSLRNFTLDLVQNGMDFERDNSYGKKELKRFADSFDRVLTRLVKEAKEKPRQDKG
ncbi:MAG: DUF188 domain-containing protein [Spirochaetaceae bacterium]|jgi:uncharacterized protein YaiI (UPF0178 family)|nr:DUF188 domain-containing protein [Spirochaetaceae bacterium]